MRFLVLGRGSSGRAAAALAARRGDETVTLDGDEAFPAHFTEMHPRGRDAHFTEMRPRGRDAHFTEMRPRGRDAHFTEMRPRGEVTSGETFDGAIVSPGIPLDHPWQVACRAAGIPVKSELQFGCEELRRQGVRLLAVTGSKGKSSVVKLVADALTRAGHPAVPCGNYGRPVCDVAVGAAEGERRETRDGRGAGERRETRDGSGAGERRETRDARGVEWAVVEVSSFQLETTELPPDTFEAAVILNLQEDHLDRHGSVGVYHALKRKLLGFARSGQSCCRTLAVSPGATATTSVQQQESSPGATATTSVQQQESHEAALLAGSYFDNEILRPNGEAAIFLLRAAGLGDKAIRAAFVAFEPLPHRMNTVGVFGGVTCIDDSKATSLAALAAGVKMASSLSSHDSRPLPAPRIRLIAGGLPKGDDPKDALPILTARVKKVYLIGTSAEVFSAAWSGSVACQICGTMDCAVKAAMREAESGETVLLSPGTASFDQFQSFGERGDVFADLVQKQGKNK